MATESEFRALLQQAQRDLGENHPALIYPLVALADEYSSSPPQHAEAEHLYTRAIAIWGEQYPDHWRLAQPLNNLGVLYAKQEKFTEAEPLIKWALEIEELHLESGERLYPPLSSLIYVYLMQGKEEQASATYQRREEIADQYKDDPDALRGWYPPQLTRISFEGNLYDEAKAVYQQALKEHDTSIWQEIKQRTQGALDVLTGKSAAIHLQRLSELEFAHSIIEDDLAYSRERDVENGFEPER